MLDHISIGVRDVTKSKAFYDAVLAPLGYECLSDSGGGFGYGDDRAIWWIAPTEKPVPPHPDSWLHFCFEAPTRQSVDAFHAAALAAGGRDNGRPGLRAEYGPNYYAAFIVDPDGYRIEAYCGAKA